MYITFTNIKSTLAAASLATTLLFSGAAVAGPGKPGDNPIDPGGNIVEVAVAANAALGIFDTVLTAATCPSLGGAVVGILTGSDKVTLFAPTDEAFGLIGLDETNVCDVPAETLLTILGYHVTDGRRFSNSLFNARNWKTVDMLIGGSVSTYFDGDTPTLVDNMGREAPVVLANINASNGVIHVIGAVLLP